MKLTLRNRVDDEGDDERRQQGKYEYGRKVDHKLADDALPEQQWNKRAITVAVPANTEEIPRRQPF